MASVAARIALIAAVAVFVAAPLSLAAPVSSEFPSSSNVIDTLKANPEFSTLVSLLEATGLDSALAGAGPFTVFAPDNTAFANLKSWQLKYLQANQDGLKEVLEYHVAPSVVHVSQLYVNEAIASLQGSHFFAEYLKGTTTIGLDSATCQYGVRFLDSEIAASNGFVQAIDTVMIPPAVICPDELFFVEQRGASRVGFEGYDCRAKGSTILATSQIKPVGIAVDSEAKQVFWSDDQNYKPYDSWLTSAKFDGAADVSIFVKNMYDPQGMDTDTVNKKLYFTEHQGATVKRVNYDGTGIELLYHGEHMIDFPADVAVDAKANKMFVTIQSVPEKLNGTLHMFDLNGGSQTILYSGLIMNYGVCIDRFAQHLYYVQGGNDGSISCHAYGSTPCNTKDGKDGVVIDGLQYPYMCDVDNVYAPYGGPTKIVFSEPNVPGSVYSMVNDGSDLTLLDSNLNAPMGVKLGCSKFLA